MSPSAPSANSFAALNAPRRKQPAQRWLMTFADLTGLLLCFFILFYATLTIDRDNWQALVGSFSATFAPSAVAVAVVPSGQFNAIPVVQTRRSIMYLDTLLRQRVATDEVWQSLRGTEVLSENAIVYPLNPALNEITRPAIQEAWLRLGALVRTWQTPVAVRVVVPESADWKQATTQAWALAQAAARGGARVTAEVRRGSIAQSQWVLYGAD
jgi:hypothetical protein